MNFNVSGGPKSEQKSNKNRCKNDVQIGTPSKPHFFSIWVGLGPQDGPQNRPQIDQKSILGAHGDPKAAQDPPKTLPRPKIDPKSTPNPPQIDPKSTPNRPKTHPTSTQLLCEGSKQKLLKIKPLSTKIMQG